MEDNKQKDGIVKTKLAKLIDVKSIMTLALTGAFIWLTISGSVAGSEYMNIFVVVIGFYFGVQSKKNEKTGE